MSHTIWTPHAVSSEAFTWQGQVWRMVESQHIASTMKLVDNRDEQDVLESLLESSKPLWPENAKQLDYLLATPFRYRPKRGGSRFRSETDPGVFYAAQSIQTVGAELGYWRWKFLKDAVDLKRIEPMPHTAFCAKVQTQVVDLQKPPFDFEAERWKHPTDYTATQHFARVAREAQIGGILHCSVRNTQPSWCLALLTPTGFVNSKPQPTMQTWYLAVSQDKVTLRRDVDSMQFSSEGW